MNASTDALMSITPGVAARIAELGMRKELEQRIDHIRAVVPGLAAIEVAVVERYDAVHA